MKGNNTENHYNDSVAQNKLRMCINNPCSCCCCCIHFSTCLPIETVCEYEVQYRQRLEQERAQWNQYRESVERELGELRRRLTEGQEEENLEDEMKKVGLYSSVLRISLSEEKFFLTCTRNITTQTTDLSHTDDPVKRIFHFTLKPVKVVLKIYWWLLKPFQGTRRCREAAVGRHAHGAGNRRSEGQADDCWGTSEGTGGGQGEPVGRRQLTYVIILTPLLQAFMMKGRCCYHYVRQTFVLFLFFLSTNNNNNKFYL